MERILTAKISEKKILYKVLEGILTAKIANIKKFCFLSFLYIKGLNIEMDLISVEWYENAKVICLNNNAGYLWVSMKDVGIGLGVRFSFKRNTRYLWKKN